MARGVWCAAVEIVVVVLGCVHTPMTGVAGIVGSACDGSYSKQVLCVRIVR